MPVLERVGALQSLAAKPCCKSLRLPSARAACPAARWCSTAVARPAYLLSAPLPAAYLLLPTDSESLQGWPWGAFPASPQPGHKAGVAGAASPGATSVGAAPRRGRRVGAATQATARRVGQAKAAASVSVKPEPGGSSMQQGGAAAPGASVKQEQQKEAGTGAASTRRGRGGRSTVPRAMRPAAAKAAAKQPHTAAGASAAAGQPVHVNVEEMEEQQQGQPHQQPAVGAALAAPPPAPPPAAAAPPAAPAAEVTVRKEIVRLVRQHGWFAWALLAVRCLQCDASTSCTFHTVQTGVYAHVMGVPSCTLAACNVALPCTFRRRWRCPTCCCARGCTRSCASAGQRRCRCRSAPTCSSALGGAGACWAASRRRRWCAAFAGSSGGRRGAWRHASSPPEPAGEGEAPEGGSGGS